MFSKETYWISNLCRDGVFTFNAWRFPSDRFAAIAFANLLFALDETGVPVRDPVAVPAAASAKANSPRRPTSGDLRAIFFTVKVADKARPTGLPSSPGRPQQPRGQVLFLAFGADGKLAVVAALR